MKNINKQLLIGVSPNSKLMKIYKERLKSVSSLQMESLIGLILGDGSL